ncbi:NAD(P)-binding protein [Exidia glandulosa HHB12029]|uniref:NAD(P)-binding protein n=1 Tax=Exidia glandulosa HHB12029 TaxID=1314781 RepID=A0A166AVA0_EXIGL|nr:NAD(P)-binding protein [Exidia glandulosa HHB12029]
MAPETSSAPNLAGHVVFVTGGASGVGLRTFRSLARMGAKAYLADINEVGGRAAVDELKREGHDVVFFPLDLGTMQSAKKAADEFLQTEDRLDILVNNAALLSKEYELSPDGIVDTMSVNYFGHYILTNCLLPLLKRTAAQPQSDVRIVTVGSHGHGWLKTQRFATLDQFNEKYGGNSTNGQMMRYCTAKLAETLWAMGLQKQLDAEGANITCILVHPGSIYSEGADKRVKTLPFGVRHAVRFTLRRAFDTPETGSMTSVFAATAPEVLSKPDVYKGAYLMPIKGKAVPSSVVGQALDKDLAKELSASTERMVAERLGQGWRQSA